MNFPIALKHYFFTRLVIIANPLHRPKGTQNTLDAGAVTEIEVTEVEGSPGEYAVKMTTKLEANSNDAIPYTIDVECVGSFTADSSLDINDQRRGITIVGHSVLYGAIREAVLWTTGRQVWGALSLGLSVLQPTEAKPAE